MPGSSAGAPRRRRIHPSRAPSAFAPCAQPPVAPLPTSSRKLTTFKSFTSCRCARVRVTDRASPVPKLDGFDVALAVAKGRPERAKALLLSAIEAVASKRRSGELQAQARVLREACSGLAAVSVEASLVAIRHSASRDVAFCLLAKLASKNAAEGSREHVQHVVNATSTQEETVSRALARARDAALENGEEAKLASSKAAGRASGPAGHVRPSAASAGARPPHPVARHCAGPRERGYDRDDDRWEVYSTLKDNETLGSISLAAGAPPVQLLV